MFQFPILVCVWVCVCGAPIFPARLNSYHPTDQLCVVVGGRNAGAPVWVSKLRLQDTIHPSWCVWLQGSQLGSLDLAPCLGENLPW